LRGPLLQISALSPTLHAELWNKYKAEGLPPNDVIRHYLVFERNFNPDSVDGFIAQFRDTIAYAKLDASGKIEAPSESETPDRGELAIGDFVQWESQGVAQFVEPRKVIGITPDGGFVFVEDSLTGLPIDEVRRVDPANGKPTPMTQQTVEPQPLRPVVPTAPVNPHYKPSGPPAGAKQYVLTVDTGEVVLRWPESLSDEDYETIESWIEGMKKKIKRSVTEPEN
jgi:hypothetical protein